MVFFNPTYAGTYATNKALVMLSLFRKRIFQHPYDHHVVSLLSFPLRGKQAKVYLCLAAYFNSLNNQKFITCRDIYI